MAKTAGYSAKSVSPASRTHRWITFPPASSTGSNDYGTTFWVMKCEKRYKQLQVLVLKYFPREPPSSPVLPLGRYKESREESQSPK